MDLNGGVSTPKRVWSRRERTIDVDVTPEPVRETAEPFLGKRKSKGDEASAKTALAADALMKAVHSFVGNEKEASEGSRDKLNVRTLGHFARHTLHASLHHPLVP